MTDHHAPSPEYVDHLRWQVMMEARRRERFGPPSERSMPRLMRFAGVMFAGLLIGAGTTVAAAQYERRQERTDLLAAVEIEHELARTETLVYEEELERVRRLAEAGFAATSDIAEVELEAKQARAREAILTIDAAEIRASGRAPDRRLVAPVFGGRDFVRERLLVHRNLAERRGEFATERLATAEARARAGAVSNEEIDERDLELQLADESVRRLETRLALRAKFNGGEASVRETEIADRLDEARAEARRAESELSSLERRAARHETMVEHGQASRDRSLTLALARARARWELAGVRLESLEEKSRQLPH